MIGHCYWNSILPWFSKLSVTVPVRRGVWRTASWTRTAAEMGSQPVGAKNWVSQPEDDIWLVVWNHGILFSPIVGMMIQSDELHHFSGGLKDLYDIWLVVWNHGILWLSIQLGMSSSQLANSYFSEGWVYHQPVVCCFLFKWHCRRNCLIENAYKSGEDY